MRHSLAPDPSVVSETSLRNFWNARVSTAPSTDVVIGIVREFLQEIPAPAWDGLPVALRSRHVAYPDDVAELAFEMVRLRCSAQASPEPALTAALAVFLSTASMRLAQLAELAY